MLHHAPPYPAWDTADGARARATYKWDINAAAGDLTPACCFLPPPARWAGAFLSFCGTERGLGRPCRGRTAGRIATPSRGASPLKEEGDHTCL